jgi:uncharacterized protein YwqG
MNYHLPLHPLFEPYRQEIEATLKPCVRINATPAKTKLWQSKFGGWPYIPLDTSIKHLSQPSKRFKEFFPYPRNKETGEALYMLAQLNFEEIPHIESFPEKGILQVLIDIRTIYDGMNPDNRTDQTAFRIIYYPTVHQDESMLWTDFSKINPAAPNSKEVECELRFEKSFEPISLADYRFGSGALENFANAFYNDGDYNYDANVTYTTLLHWDNKNKIGGYHYSQNFQDPRLRYFSEDEESILLIQFDGNDVFCWGDAGTANFFIKKKDLENLDFSNVIYNWDST